MPVPQPEPPKRELPSAPVPKPNAVAPHAAAAARQPEAIFPKTPLKLETPDMPVPQNGLILPKQVDPREMRFAMRARQSGKINSPAPIGGGGQLPARWAAAAAEAGAEQRARAMQMLTDTEGVDFNDYLQRVYITVKQNWFSVMPASVQLGDQGVVSLQFKIHERWQRARRRSRSRYLVLAKSHWIARRFLRFARRIRSSHCRRRSRRPYIELRFTYYYNYAAAYQ